MKPRKELKTVSLRFDIPVDPGTVAMQSARHSIVAGRVHSYQPAEKVNTKLEIRAWLKAQPDVVNKIDLVAQKDAFVRIKKLAYVFSPPANLSAHQRAYSASHGVLHKNTRPDLADNLKKLLMDAMTGIVFFDDSRIVSEDGVEKYFGEPRILVEMEIEWYA